MSSSECWGITFDTKHSPNSSLLNATVVFTSSAQCDEETLMADKRIVYLCRLWWPHLDIRFESNVKAPHSPYGAGFKARIRRVQGQSRISVGTASGHPVSHVLLTTRSIMRRAGSRHYHWDAAPGSRRLAPLFIQLGGTERPKPECAYVTGPLIQAI